MPQVGAEGQQMACNFFFAAMTRLQGTHGKRMPNVVKAGSLGSRTASQASRPYQAQEHVVDGGVSKAGSPVRDEQGGGVAANLPPKD